MNNVVHEIKVKNFYSTGSKRRMCDYYMLKQKDEGFLSFGYWKKDTRTYLDAANNLLNYFIENSNIKETGRILNVACGYGTETFAYYYRFKPDLIEGIDITKVHVDYANNKAKSLNLDNKIKFYHGDACILNFPDNTFSHIFGIEGPAHFSTREKFFKAASRVLKEKGELLLTDIVLGKKFNNINKFQRLIVELTAKKWIVPKANWIDEGNYKKQLEKEGLKVVFLKKMGGKVFPGYANNGFSIKTIKTRISQRGPLAIIGLTIISYFLGYLYRKGLIEYIYVKAKKKDEP
jgi:ubiquinone/menaquinone biosynthesis C-methylase UbiE